MARHLLLPAMMVFAGRADAEAFIRQLAHSAVMQDDTIFALASGAGVAAIAVMRLSGPATGAAVRALCGTMPPPRQASLRTLRNADGAILDRGLVLWLPGPGSYTGEDSAELHLHGGRAVVAAVADALVARRLRPAEPGEFTRRAFLHGRLDLVEAEAVHDLVGSWTELWATCIAAGPTGCAAFWRSRRP
jgi:tRNA modification GTPase